MGKYNAGFEKVTTFDIANNISKAYWIFVIFLSHYKYFVCEINNGFNNMDGNDESQNEYHYHPGAWE